MINCLNTQLSNMKTNIDIISDVQVTLLLQIKKRFGLLELVTSVAVSTLLDPRFKNLHFLNPNACAQAMTSLRKLVNTNNTSLESQESTITTKVFTEYDFWNHHKTLVHSQIVKVMETNGNMNDELSLYLNSPVADLKCDPLQLWENIKNTFPLLYKEARHHFSMVATSVPCERLFSKAGSTITKTRNRLLGSRLEKLLFLSDFEEDEWF